MRKIPEEITSTILELCHLGITDTEIASRVGVSASYVGIKRRSAGINLSCRSRMIHRFFSKIDRSGGPDACHVWLACLSKSGYGKFQVRKGLSNPSHRVAWEIAIGAIPSGLCVCHKCDNPPCCNPLHMFLGTITDNNLDRYCKNRSRASSRLPRGVYVNCAGKYHARNWNPITKNYEHLGSFNGIEDASNTAARYRLSVVSSIAGDKP